MQFLSSYAQVGYHKHHKHRIQNKTVTALAPYLIPRSLFLKNFQDTPRFLDTHVRIPDKHGRKHIADEADSFS